MVISNSNMICAMMKVSKLHLLIDTVTACYEKYFFGDVARELYDFFWADFADW